MVNAAVCLKAGGVIAHATEGVWGLACDPFNRKAVDRILTIKGREAAKGMLLIGASSDTFDNTLAAMEPDLRARVEASWPGHVTWLLPGDAYPQSIRGQHQTVACRVPDHTQAREIAAAFGGSLVSTSLNRAGEPPVLQYSQAKALFHREVDLVVPGQTAGYTGASAIIDLDGTDLYDMIKNSRHSNLLECKNATELSRFDNNYIFELYKSSLYQLLFYILNQNNEILRAVKEDPDSKEMRTFALIAYH